MSSHSETTFQLVVLSSLPLSAPEPLNWRRPMTEKEIRLLFTVRDTCKANPEMVAKVVDAANTGLRDMFEEMRELSANIEAVAMLAMARRTKGIDKALLAKLKQVNGKSFVKWDSDIAKLEKTNG